MKTKRFLLLAAPTRSRLSIPYKWVLFVVALLVLASSPLQAQNQPGSLDTSFQLVKMYVDCLAADGSSIIEDVVLTGDGKILVGGHFESGEPDLGGLAKLNLDGSLDTNFVSQAPLYNDTHTVFVQSDGKIIAGHSRSWRVNPDGSLEIGRASCRERV